MPSLGHQGGQGQLGYSKGYYFNEIHVENSAWQLFQFAVAPSIWEFGNTQLGSISNLSFNNIFVNDSQSLPNLFQGFDLQHRVSGVTFNGVAIAGKIYNGAQPTTFDANRMFSLDGNTLSSPVLGNLSSSANPNIQVWQMVQGVPSSSPVASVQPINEPLLNNANLAVVGYGDFYGDGYASPLIFNSSQNVLEILQEPLNSALPSPATQFSLAYILPAGYQFAGVGDFNGDGITDVLIWNSALQQGQVLTMNGSQLSALTTILPGHTSSWRVAGVGDFDKNGASDVLLRDDSGNLEILYFSASNATSVADINESALGFGTSNDFKQTNPTSPTSGHFDSTWNVAGVVTVSDECASILWVNPSSGELGLTEFSATVPQKLTTQVVFATLPAGSSIAGLGDFNGDGTTDILYWNPSSGQSGIYYLGWMGGAYYQSAPAIQQQVSAGWQFLNY